MSIVTIITKKSLLLFFSLEVVMRFEKIISENYCGVDLHSRSMYVTVLDKTGTIRFRRNLTNDFTIFKNCMEPFLPNVAVGVESTYNWYWLADGCHEAGIPFYLGHAFYMKAITGGKKKNDKLDSQTIANLMRTNFFPLAYDYPREMRPVRDLLRRRNYFVALRAAGNAHIQTIFSQEGILNVKGADVKRKSTRRSLVEDLSDFDLGLSVECDLDFMESLDPIISKLEKRIRKQAKHHDRNAFDILQTTPGIGDIIALTILYEMHKIERFASVQQFSSYCRVVKCEKTSDGKPTGRGNQKIGNPYLKWAFNQIILRAQNDSALIKRYYNRLVSKHGSRKAMNLIGHKFAIAVYYMLKNGKAFDERRFLNLN